MTPDGACDSSAGLVIQWNSFNMAAHVRDTPRSLNFDIVYDTAHSRIKRCSPNCTAPQSTTLYLNDPATGTMEEANISGGTTTWTDYIAASGGIVAIRNNSGIGTTSYLYVTGDHLGSVSLISDASGGLIASGRQSYDPWGQRRNADGTPASSCSAKSSPTTRGYTGQEEMDSGCLVNLNGRFYYPVIGRMLSADPTIPDPLNPQSYNRYSYVNNNPLNATDPSGYVKAPCPSGVCQFKDQKCIVCGSSDNNPAAFLSAGQAGNFFAEAASSSISCVGTACGVMISGHTSVQAFEENPFTDAVDIPAGPPVIGSFSFFESLSDFEASGFNNGLSEQTFGQPANPLAASWRPLTAPGQSITTISLISPIWIGVGASKTGTGNLYLNFPVVGPPGVTVSQLYSANADALVSGLSGSVTVGYITFAISPNGAIAAGGSFSFTALDYAGAGGGFEISNGVLIDNQFFQAEEQAHLFAGP